MEYNNISYGQNGSTLLIEIKVKPPVFFIKTLLTVFIGVSILLPIIILIVAIIMEFPIGSGYFISLLIFATSLTYFIRLYLWNTYGKEVFLIENNSILHYNDYKFFKDNITQTSFKNVSYGFIPTKEDIFIPLIEMADIDEQCRFSILIDNNEIIESDILSRSQYLKKIMQ